MAETLGSLVDKLSIKNLRLWHLDELIETKGDADPDAPHLKAKRDLVARQQQDLADEIDAFLAAAFAGKVKIRDEKVKLYLNPNAKPTGRIGALGEAVGELALRNIRLWHLEDEVRRPDLDDKQTVAVKRQIDAANQERNDLIDKVDEILEKQVEAGKSKKSLVGKKTPTRRASKNRPRRKPQPAAKPKPKKRSPARR
ncbi:MAG: DUF4254 domain-containing protein [Nitrospinae bacterium]|nr:DUF4254 domain-containing protein [Nitrospinota bacterium]